MKVFTVTLMSDGSSDSAIVPILEWLIAQKLESIPFQVSVVRGDLAPSAGLLSRAHRAIDNFPCDLLVIHRDAERIGWRDRIEEIRLALKDHQLGASWIPVVPVRMTEAWLLHDQHAIRRAAGNPNGDATLQLVGFNQWETIADPKEMLFRAFRLACGLSGRRLQKFDVHHARYRLATLIEDFSPLRRLETFNHFEKNLDDAIAATKTNLIKVTLESISGSRSLADA